MTCRIRSQIECHRSGGFELWSGSESPQWCSGNEGGDAVVDPLGVPRAVTFSSFTKISDLFIRSMPGFVDGIRLGHLGRDWIVVRVDDLGDHRGARTTCTTILVPETSVS